MRHMRALIAMYIAPVLVARNLPAHSRFDELIDGARTAYQADKVDAFDSWKSIESAVLLKLLLLPVRQAYDFIDVELTKLYPGDVESDQLSEFLLSLTPEETMQGFMLILLSPQNQNILSVDDPNDKVLKQQVDIVQKMEIAIKLLSRDEEKINGYLEILSKFWPADRATVVPPGKKEFLAPVTKVLYNVYELANNLAQPDAQPELVSERQTENPTQKPAWIPNVSAKAVLLWQILSVTQLSAAKLRCLLDPSKCPRGISQETILDKLSPMMNPLPCDRRRRLQGGRL
eukprot:GEMP01023123.1.p1 GENE.GEMP01023123.1~~GEMP01023123.1.p1  ORF type:complete len:288 (+),score=42.45 GEMP01023123.1:183-1046(+)